MQSKGDKITWPLVTACRSPPELAVLQHDSEDADSRIAKGWLMSETRTAELQITSTTHNLPAQKRGKSPDWQYLGLIWCNLIGTGSHRQRQAAQRHHDVTRELSCPLWHTVHHLAPRSGQLRTGGDPYLKA